MGLLALPIEVGADRSLSDFSDEAGLLLGLQGRCLMIPQPLHWPTLGNGPTSRFSSRDEADLLNTVARSHRQCRNLLEIWRSQLDLACCRSNLGHRDTRIPLSDERIWSTTS